MITQTQIADVEQPTTLDDSDSAWRVDADLCLYRASDGYSWPPGSDPRKPKRAKEKTAKRLNLDAVPSAKRTARLKPRAIEKVTVKRVKYQGGRQFMHYSDGSVDVFSWVVGLGWVME